MSEERVNSNVEETVEKQEMGNSIGLTQKNKDDNINEDSETYEQSEKMCVKKQLDLSKLKSFNVNSKIKSVFESVQMEKHVNWIELYKCIRHVYRNAISSNEDINADITDEYRTSIRNLIDKLWEEDWQQLLIRLEVSIRDFVIEARDRLKDLEDDEDLPVCYLKELLSCYAAFCSAANTLGPFLPQIDTLLMKRFSVNFELLNKYLFQACLYSDSFVQNNIPLYISQTQYTNQDLIHSYLVFDEEMTDIASKWLDVKKLILQYSKKRTLTHKNGTVLLEDWEIYREQREIAANKTWCTRLSINKNDSAEFDVQLLSLIDDLTSRLPENNEMKSISLHGAKQCKNCNMAILCICDDCTIKHMLVCGLDTPPVSPPESVPISYSQLLHLRHAEFFHHFKFSPKKCMLNQENKTPLILPDTQPSLIQPQLPNSKTHPSCFSFPFLPGYYPTSNKTEDSKFCVDTTPQEADIEQQSEVADDETVNDDDGESEEYNENDTTSKVPANSIPNENIINTGQEEQNLRKNSKVDSPIKSAVDLKLEERLSQCDQSVVRPMLSALSANTETDTKMIKPRMRDARIRTCGTLNCEYKYVIHTSCKKRPVSKNPNCSNSDTCSGCIIARKQEAERIAKMKEIDLSKRKPTISTAARLAKSCNVNCCKKSPVTLDQNTNEKNCKTLRHCDCSHTETFESSLGSHTNSKFNKMRDRLRSRLNEKRSIAMKENIQNHKPVTPKIEQPNKKEIKEPKVQPESQKHENENIDTRDIKDLLNFIEGNDTNTKLIDAQKKAARKLKRQAKKLEIQKQKEEEKLRLEEEKLIEQFKTQLKISQKEESTKSTKKNGKNKKNQPTNNNSNTQISNPKNSVSCNTPNPNTNSKKKNSPEVETKVEPVKTGPMVTIKRVVEGNREPTVTITLKGSTPDKDKLLYTLVNGQSEISSSEKVTTEEKKPELSKKQKKKLKKEAQKKAAEAAQAAAIIKSKEKKDTKAEKKNQTKPESKKQNEPKNSAKEKDNSITVSLSSKNDSMLNLQMLRLPPGITITKVEGPTNTKKLNLNPKTSASNTTTPATATPTVLQPSDNQSGIIVVDTVKLKQDLPETASTTEKGLSQRSKKNKKKKNKKGDSQNNTIKQQTKSSTPKQSTTTLDSNNSNSILTLKNPMFYQLQESVSEKMQREAKAMETQQDNNQQASIIKGANGMVTIRSPRLNTMNGSCNGRGIPFMSLHSVGAPVLSELKPVVNANNSTYVTQTVKREQKKPFNAQEILSGLPGIEITKINKNTIRNKNECKKVFQPADVSIIPTNATNGTNGDIYKLFYDNSDWSLESVFAPKDIKEDEVLDADELELEAFKRFCQQSVPPERKEKVAYLNVKDIVLKKKSSNTN